MNPEKEKRCLRKKAYANLPTADFLCWKVRFLRAPEDIHGSLPTMRNARRGRDGSWVLVIGHRKLAVVIKN